MAHLINKKELRNFYEEQARILPNHQQEMYGKKDIFAIRRMKQIISFSQRSHAQNFLDVGCAEGFYLKCFNKYVSPRGQAVGIDIALQYLLKARERFPAGLYIQADSEFLPFRNACFDMVLCSEVLEHTPNPKEVFKELVRVSRGYVVVTTPGHGLLYYLVLKIKPLYRWLLKKKYISKEEPLHSLELGGGHISDVEIKNLAQWAKELECPIKEAKVCYSLLFPTPIPKFISLAIAIFFDFWINLLPISKRKGCQHMIFLQKY